jgi:hypothetical protein
MADFTWVPNYVLNRTVKYVTRTSEGETGKETLRSKRTNGIYGFSLKFDRLTTSQADAMFAFFIAKKGKATWFTWLNPIDSVTYTVRFDDDEMGQGYFRFGRYSTQVNFRVKTT